MIEPNGLGNSFVETIAHSELGETIPEFMDVSIDLFLDDGIIKEIPIIKSIWALIKSTVKVSDYLLMKKILLFFNATSIIDCATRKNFVKQLSENPKFKQRVGEQIMLYIDRLDDIEKPSMVGNAFNGFIQGEINFELFQRLAVAIDRSFVGDLKKLKKYYATKNEYFRGAGRETLYQLSQSGLVLMESHVVLGTNGIIYEPSELGEIFIKLVLK
jgi:hypothetical protein